MRDRFAEGSEEDVICLSAIDFGKFINENADKSDELDGVDEADEYD